MMPHRGKASHAGFLVRRSLWIFLFDRVLRFEARPARHAMGKQGLLTSPKSKSIIMHAHAPLGEERKCHESFEG